MARHVDEPSNASWDATALTASELAGRVVACRTGDPRPPSAQRRRVWGLPAVVLSHGLQHCYVAGIALAYPAVVKEFHISYAQLGVVLGVAGVAGGLLQGVSALIRHARTAVILTAQNLSLAACCLGAAVTPTFLLFGAARLAGSAVSWPQHPVGSAYLADRYPRRRAWVLAWHTAGGNIGSAVAPLGVAILMTVAGWRTALAALAGLIAVGAALVWLWLPAGRPSNPREIATEPSARLRTVLVRKEPISILMAATVAAAGRGLGTLTAFVPAYLSSGLHLSSLWTGTIFATVIGAGIAGTVLGGRAAEHFGSLRVLILTYCAGAAALLAFGSSRSVLLLLSVGAAMGLFAYAESPLVQAIYVALTEQTDRRRAFGLYFTVSYGVGALWLALLGWIVDAAGFTVTFAAMAGSFVLAATILVLGLGTGRTSGAVPV